MPPETLKFNKYSFFSDVWAMGIIAYELVYGVSPWQNKDDAQLFEQITSTPISNLFDPTIPISNHYKTFIVHCLQPNISQRANPHIIFNYPWPLSDNFVQGY
jgi:serine/threonine protein kinase